MKLFSVIFASRNWEIIQGRISGQIPAPGSDFDKIATPSILCFEIFVLLSFLAAMIILPRFVKRLTTRFLAVICAVLIFELFTAPLWRNLRMGSWAYLYQQVSWILTLGWSTLILSVVILVDHYFPEKTELKRLGIYLAILTPVVFCFEILLGAISLRSYAPEVIQTVCGIYIFGVPIEALYYVPVFSVLIISFYKYWSFIIDDVPIMPLAHIPVRRTLIIATIGVLLFELMIEPIVQNQGFPSWSYLYKDISILMTAYWIIVLWLAAVILEKFLPHWPLAYRFFTYLSIIGVIAVPSESLFIHYGLRVYGPSAVANFSGLTLPGTEIPIEIVFAIPLYFALVVTFIRYIDIALTNKKLVYVC